MRYAIMLIISVFLFLTCEKQVVYEQDPRYFNDAFHGHIVGKVIQTESEAKAVVSQEVPIDSQVINPEDGVFRFEDLEIGNYDLTIVANNFRTYQHKNVHVEGGGTHYLGEIDLSDVPDLVSSHYPEDMAEVVYNNRFHGLTISVQFTQPMDRESVEKAFSTVPETEGTFYWGQFTTAPSNYYFGWTSEDGRYGGFDPGATITTYSKISSFVYKIAQKDCFTDTTYQVQLATSAMDTSGNKLRFPLEFSFSTVQSSSTINGIQTVPAHGDIEVELISNTGIQITFPRNMDASSTEKAVNISPETDPIFIWPAYNQLTIYTGGSFYADTTYTIKIDSTAEDLDGIRMGHNYEFSFQTAGVGLRTTSPRNGQLYVDPHQNIVLYFNTYMIKSSVEQAFTIEPEISGSLYWGDGNSTYNKAALFFNPHTALQYNKKYTVTVNSSAKDLFGTQMKEDYSFSFITRPE